MKALSVRQPWAHLIVHGPKRVENRSWSTPFRGHFLIHASKGMTVEDYDLGRACAWTYGRHRLTAAGDLHRGGIIGRAMLVDCKPNGESPADHWAEPGLFGFLLADVEPLPFVPCQGALGFFSVPSSALRLLGLESPEVAAGGEHRCHARGCTTPVPPRLLMCGPHWRMVPRDMQRAVWRYYVPGQEERKDPTRDYLEAAAVAIQFVAEAEARAAEVARRQVALPGVG